MTAFSGLRIRCLAFSDLSRLAPSCDEVSIDAVNYSCFRTPSADSVLLTHIRGNMGVSIKLGQQVRMFCCMPQFPPRHMWIISRRYSSAATTRAAAERIRAETYIVTCHENILIQLRAAHMLMDVRAGFERTIERIARTGRLCVDTERRW